MEEMTRAINVKNFKLQSLYGIWVLLLLATVAISLVLDARLMLD